MKQQKPDWIEVDPTYLIDQKKQLVGKGRRRRMELMPRKPQRAWLFTTHCFQRARSVVRKKTVLLIEGDGKRAITRQIDAYMERPDVRPAPSAGV